VEFGNCRRCLRRISSCRRISGHPAQTRYTHARVFWIFLGRFWRDGACVCAVQSFLAWLKSVEGKRLRRNRAYCSARRNFRSNTSRRCTSRLSSTWTPEPPVLGTPRHGRGRLSVSMPTPRGIRPRGRSPSAQKTGCGFPVMRILAVFSLATGIWRGLGRARFTSRSARCFTTRGTSSPRRYRAGRHGVLRLCRLRAA